MFIIQMNGRRSMGELKTIHLILSSSLAFYGALRKFNGWESVLWATWHFDIKSIFG